MAKVIIESLDEFNDMIGFWSQAKTNWEELSEEDREIANDLFNIYEWESLTEVNDFVWFDLPDMLEELKKGRTEYIEELESSNNIESPEIIPEDDNLLSDEVLEEIGYKK